MTINNQVLIIGGGLAGLINAIHLSKNGLSVLVLEKNSYPKHKVCGEYISNEVLPYLKSLGFDPLAHKAKNIKNILLSSSKGNHIKAKLPLGGFSISRFTLDYVLAQKAKENGVRIINDTVTQIEYKNNLFSVFTKSNSCYTSQIVIGAYGKRANLDIKLNRKFIQKKAPYLAVKAHYKGKFPEDLVGLHNFIGGYCGVSKIENDHINICYITDYQSFKKYKNIEDFQQKVVYQNVHLKNIFENTKLAFSKPITISQISFSAKNTVEDHVLMCGDTASMIHPLCGNGMGMAIHAAQIASELIVQYFSGQIESRAILEKKYDKLWKKEFEQRLKLGRVLAKLFRMTYFSEVVLVFLKMFPWVLPIIIKNTHGKLLKPLSLS